MKRWLVYVLSGVVAIGLMILVLLPAAWFSDMVSDHTGHRLQLDDVTGSVWHGSGVLVVLPPIEGQPPVALPGRIGWRLDILPLFAARVSGVLIAEQMLAEPTRFVVTPSGVHLEAGRLQLPTTWLAGLGAPLNTLNLTGTMALNWASFQGTFGSRPGWQGRATLRLMDVSTPLAPISPVGSYRIELAGDGPQTQIDLATESGALRLDGRGDVTDGKLRFMGRAVAMGPAAQSLAGLISVIGRSDGQGGATLRYGPTS